MTTDTAAAWPRIEATIHDDGTGEVSIGGSTHQVQAEDLPAARDQVRRLVADTARKLGRPVRAVMTDPDGQWPLIVKTDGTLEADETAEARPRPRTETPARTAAEPARPAAAPADDTTAAEAAPPAPGPQPSPAQDQPYETRRERRERQSFLTQEQREEPATQGWRGAMTRLGIRMSPSPAERAERADIQAVSQHWPGPRTIAIVNGKGGASKTPSTILLSAVFARYGGAGVLTWDNNQTRGTLGWRTEQGPHESTVLDLLPAATELLGTGAQSADLARYVHHQTADRFDVLRSQPLALASEQRLSAEDVDAIWNVARKYYRLVFIDTGNDESDAMWGRLVDHADQIVVATTTRDDHAEAGALLLEALADRSERSAQLAQHAVVVVSQADPRATSANISTVVNGFTSLAREVATIPHDPQMVEGWLNVAALRPATQRAWLGAAAAVARGL